MTISSTANRTSTAGNGSTTAFSFPYLDDDLKVILVVDSTGIETTQTITTHYTVTGAGVAAGGTVTMVTAPASGETLVVIREAQYTQGLDLVENDPFPSALVEQQFDTLTMQTQQLKDITDRSLRLSDGDTADTNTLMLPASTARASRIMSFDSSGNVTTTAVDSLSLATLQAFTNYQIFTATGNGSTTSYTLAAEPGQEANTQIYLDGVYQSKSNYSLTGATLTFSTAPPSSVAIEVVFGTAASTYVPVDNSIAYEKIKTSDIDTDLSSVSGSDDTFASAKSIKTYVDAQVTASDLDFQADSGGALSIDLDAESLTLAGGTGIDTVGSGNTVTAAIDSTVATLTGSQTLTNKTLTAPTLTGSVVATGTIDGRDLSTDGSKLDGIEASADVTDATNVNSAGAVMETDYNANTVLSANADNTPLPLTIAASRLLGRKSSGNIAALDAEESRTIIGAGPGSGLYAADYSVTPASGDITSAFNTMVAAARSLGEIILYFPNGKYQFDSKPSDLGGLILLGEGNSSTNFLCNYNPASNTEGFLEFTTGKGGGLRDLGVLASATTARGAAIKIGESSGGGATDGDYTFLQNINITENVSTGLWYDGVHLDGTQTTGGIRDVFMLDVDIFACSHASVYAYRAISCRLHSVQGFPAGGTVAKFIFTGASTLQSTNCTLLGCLGDIDWDWVANTCAYGIHTTIDITANTANSLIVSAATGTITNASVSCAVSNPIATSLSGTHTVGTNSSGNSATLQKSNEFEFKLNGDTASQLGTVTWNNNSGAETGNIWATGDSSSGTVFRIKSLGSIDLVPGGVGIDGTAGWSHSTASLTAANAAGPALMNEAASVSNPTLIPDKGVPATGFGSNGANTVYGISNGSENLRFGNGAVTVTGSLTVSGGVRVLDGTALGFGDDQDITLTHDHNVGIGLNAGSTIYRSAAGQYDAAFTVREAVAARAHFEWGHSNTGGYGSVLGVQNGGGQPYISFMSGPGTNSNTFRTYGKRGAGIYYNGSTSMVFYDVSTATADNQTATTRMTLNTTNGDLTVTGSLTANNAAGPALMNEAATETNPTLVPDKADPDTGVGWVSANIGSLVAGGTSAMQWSATGVGVLMAPSYALDVRGSGGTATQISRWADATPTQYVGIYNANTGGYTPNAANATLTVRGMTTTLRSINAGGTVNASGADYAEYMTKAVGCGDIAKGAVCGVDADGKLTDVFENAHSFVIKSTDPSYVGGDNWGIASTDSEGNQTMLEGDALEAARQKVDRIAFSGQVPCAITGDVAVGDYVIPQAKGGDIEAVAVSNPTFDQYRLAVGKVWKLTRTQHIVAVKIG